MAETDNKAAIELLDSWLALPVVEETPEDAALRRKINGETDAELARLRDAVVEAAKEWYRVQFKLTPKERTITEDLNSPIELAESVAELVKFESENS